MTKQNLYFLGSDICPVNIYTLYMSKIHPKKAYMWQRPKRKLKDVHSHWYNNSPLGKDTIGNIMKSISEKADLSKYTLITVLDIQ